MPLAEPKERIHFRSKVEAMEQSADGQWDFDAFVLSAKGETSTKSFQDWAGGGQGAIAFTEVVGSTAEASCPLIRPLAAFSPGGGEGPDAAMNEVQRAFAPSRRLIGQFQGRETRERVNAAGPSSGQPFRACKRPAVASRH